MVKTAEVYELRLYGAHVVARTAYDKRPEGISRLAAFLDDAGCPSTQPLLMRYAPGPSGGLDKTMELFVPTESADGVTSNGDVELTSAGGELVASIEFSGNVTPELAEKGARGFRV